MWTAVFCTLKLLARKEEAAVEVGRMRGDERLQDARRRGQRLLAQMLGTRGNLTPGHQSTAVRLECFLKASLRRSGIDGGREEADADGEGAVVLEGETGGTQQKVARHLRHDSDAVAAFAIGGDRSAMCKAAQRRQGMSQHFVRRLIGNTRNKAHATGIMVKARIKQRLGGKEGCGRLGSGCAWDAHQRLESTMSVHEDAEVAVAGCQWFAIVHYKPDCCH